MTPPFVWGWVAGVFTWPAVFVGVAVVGALRQGSWTSLDKLCSCPKDGRADAPGRVRSIPEPQLSPLRRCPVCGSRYARAYLRRVPGASRLLAALWSPPPTYTDDEFEARWDAHETALRVLDDSVPTKGDPS